MASQVSRFGGGGSAAHRPAGKQGKSGKTHKTERHGAKSKKTGLQSGARVEGRSQSGRWRGHEDTDAQRRLPLPAVVAASSGSGESSTECRSSLPPTEAPAPPPPRSSFASTTAAEATAANTTRTAPKPRPILPSLLRERGNQEEWVMSESDPARRSCLCCFFLRSRMNNTQTCPKRGVHGTLCVVPGLQIRV